MARPRGGQQQSFAHIRLRQTARQSPVDYHIGGRLKRRAPTFQSLAARPKSEARNAGDGARRSVGRHPWTLSGIRPDSRSTGSTVGLGWLFHVRALCRFIAVRRVRPVIRIRIEPLSRLPATWKVRTLTRIGKLNRILRLGRIGGPQPINGVPKDRRRGFIGRPFKVRRRLRPRLELKPFDSGRSSPALVRPRRQPR